MRRWERPHPAGDRAVKTPRPRALTVAVTAGLLAAALTPALLRGDPLPTIPEVAYELGTGVLFVSAGLLGWARRPDSAIGRLLVGAGLAWLAARALLWAGPYPATFTAGLVLVLLPIALLAHLAVAFPSGRASSPFERGVVVCSYLVILAGVAFVDLSGCSECPPNLLAVGRDAGLGRLAFVVVTVATLVAIAAFSTVLVTHWARGSAAGRRVLAPVLPPALVYAAVAAAGLLAEVGAPVGLGREWAWLERVVLVAIPVAFLAGLLRSRLARSGVGELVVELGESAPAGRLRDAVARALNDPTVQIGYWTPQPGRYVDGQGRTMALPEGPGPATVTVIERAGQRVAALVHDPAIREEPALLEAVCAAVGLAVENDRLHAEVAARLAQVRASRARIVAAADAARRRVERNLHDGAQQRLVAASLALAMARRDGAATGQGRRRGRDPDPRRDELVDAAAEEVHAALRELRELARGLHPAVLVEQGLAAAIDSLAERCPVPVNASANINGRLPAAVEAAAYYVVSETLANTAKHAQASAVTIAIFHCADSLRVQVTDDGVGGAAARPGSGLEGLADRVAALDGRLAVTSRPGRGTCVTAEIPCA